MGLFGIFDNDKKATSTDNGVSGPAYLDGLTEQIVDPKGLEGFEWRRRLKLSNGQTKFKIKFYGERHAQHSNLIVGTAFAPAMVYAVDNDSGAEVLLFDGCLHGYNAMFGDRYTDEQIKSRIANNVYLDKGGNDRFEITISVYYQVDFEDEDEGFLESVDEDGFIELIDGRKIPFETAKRNGFDVIAIHATDEKGNRIEIVSEELS